MIWKYVKLDLTDGQSVSPRRLVFEAARYVKACVAFVTADRANIMAGGQAVGR